MRAQIDRDVCELARHTGLTLEQAQNVAADIREELLARVRAERAQRVREDQVVLTRRLTEISVNLSPKDRTGGT